MRGVDELRGLTADLHRAGRPAGGPDRRHQGTPSGEYGSTVETTDSRLPAAAVKRSAAGAGGATAPPAA
ncbi:hypothetical protein ACFQ0M_40910 [Kitasatospora aburaviensis]